MRIALEIDDERYEVEDAPSLFDALEDILKAAGQLANDKSLEVLDREARYVLDKAGY